MQRIKLKYFQNPTKDKDSQYKDRHQYSVHTGTGSIVHFPSRTKAESFLRGYSKFLSRMLVTLNGFLVETFTLYRGAWPYMDRNPDMVRRSDTNISMATYHLNRATTVIKSHYVVSSLNVSATSMQAVCTDVGTVCRKVNSYYQVHQAEAIDERLAEVIKKIDEYGIKNPAL